MKKSVKNPNSQVRNLKKNIKKQQKKKKQKRLK